LALARSISAKHFNPARRRSLIIPLGIFAVPFALTVLEPDLTTALVFFVVLLGMFVWRGVRPFYILLLVTPVLSVIFSFHHLFWGVYIAGLLVSLLLLRRPALQIFSLFAMNSIVGVLSPVLLRDYQRSRIIAFMNPSADPRGAGWGILQSKIAIGSGGLLGKGFLLGTQKKLAFLPAVHTDLAFSVVGEELGFVGCGIVLGLLFVLIYRACGIANQARNPFGGLVALGVAIIFLAQTAINVGMNLGIVPVAGIPLPFVSYGGSSLFTSMFLVGLLLNIHRRRFDY
jgi:rod shape determining protein RodA